MNETNSINEWVSEMFSRVELFDQWDIDFCCGGKKSLKQACEEKNLNVQTVMEQLKATKSCPEDVDCRTMSAAELCDHLVNTHHEFLKKIIPRIDLHLRKIVKAHGEQYLPLKETFDLFVQDIQSHMILEETIVFPHFRSGNKEAKKFCSELEKEHNEAGELLHKIRKLTNNYTAPINACNTLKLAWQELYKLEQDMHVHVYKENHFLLGQI